VKIITDIIEDGKYRLEAAAVCCGKDLAVSVCGGDRHIGAAALGIARPGLGFPEKVSSSVSVFRVTGHKDDGFAREGAAFLCAAHHCVAVVTVGIHLEKAGAGDIGRLRDNFMRLIAALSKKIAIL
jgi:hypothetical protein